jgi:hypothetical protein
VFFFCEVAPSIAGALLLAEEEAQLWTMTGAQGLFLLTALDPNESS